jgi:hypothetical protein
MSCYICEEEKNGKKTNNKQRKSNTKTNDMKITNMPGVEAFELLRL